MVFRIDSYIKGPEYSSQTHCARGTTFDPMASRGWMRQVDKWSTRVLKPWFYRTKILLHPMRVKKLISVLRVTGSSRLKERETFPK